ncbi:MAG: hypothetical protein KJ630_16715 [Proteobacteria bacterium]|nr:hypothetical protein [Pseudomonadota bacterium]
MTAYHRVISAIGLNCMAAAAIPQIRRDHNGLPIISLTWGNTKSMSH